MNALRIAIGVVFAVLLLGAAEVGVRLVSTEPAEWPPPSGSFQLPGVRIDPLLGPLPRPGWSGAWFMDFAVDVDARGFRASASPPPTHADARVAFLGDSCTFGWGMDTPDTFVALLDARQHGTGGAQIEFVNAAYPGQSAVGGVHMLEERVLPLDPDVVVLAFGANNAFRMSLASDARRFRLFPVRKLMLHSRLYQLFAAWAAGHAPAGVDPRDRDAIMRTPLAKLERVAFLDQFEAAERDLVEAARAHGAAVLFLILPRASGVSTEHAGEDPATPPALDPWQPGVPINGREMGLLEVSCLDHRRMADPVHALHELRPEWVQVYPDLPEMRAILRRGAEAYARGEFGAAAKQFRAALALAPRSPLAHYNLGVAKLGMGDATGLRDLKTAEHLACNVFLQYQVALWRIATELHVPVVDATLFFQAHDGEPLFLDPAHPNREGHRIIADALWPAITALIAERGRDQTPSQRLRRAR